MNLRTNCTLGAGGNGGAYRGEAWAGSPGIGVFLVWIFCRRMEGKKANQRGIMREVREEDGHGRGR